MAIQIEAFCARWMLNEKNQRLLVIAGDTGTGKTHCARAAYRFCRDHSMDAARSGCWGNKKPSTKSLSWPECVVASDAKLDGGYEDALEADMLMLDDIGAEKDPWGTGKDKLCQLLSRRERRFTIVTTNAEPQAWPTRFDARICDRLFRNSIIVDLAGVQSFEMR